MKLNDLRNALPFIISNPCRVTIIEILFTVGVLALGGWKALLGYWAGEIVVVAILAKYGTQRRPWELG